MGLSSEGGDRQAGTPRVEGWRENNDLQVDVVQAALA